MAVTDTEAPGEGGKAVILDQALEKEAKRRSSLHSLNLVASDMISVNRSLPDYRNPKCLDRSYPQRLPQASVIIIFHNEPRSTLLRTVHSVINRSPRSLLKEIILVDDNSNIGEIQKG